MKRWVILAVLVVAITAIATVIGQFLPDDATDQGGAYPIVPVTTGPKPRVVVEGDPVYTFGMMAQRAEGKRTWVVRNEGEGDLLLTMVASSCSCTIASLAEGKTATVKPGGSTEITLSWNTKDRDGSYHQSATIATNDPARPTFELAAEGTVRPAIVVVPDTVINFMEVSNDEPDHRLGVILFSADKPDLKILKLTTSKPGVILAEHEPLSKEDGKALKVEAGHRVNVDVKSGLPLGVFREEVVVVTDHPRQPEMRLIVTGKMMGPIRVTPFERVRMHEVSSRRGQRVELGLLVRGHRPTRFQAARTPEKLKVEIASGDKPDEGGKYRMAVIVPPGTPPGEIDDEIVLQTDHPQASEVTIPVTIYIHDGD